jgi:hypothetical protein
MGGNRDTGKNTTHNAMLSATPYLPHAQRLRPGELALGSVEDYWCYGKRWHVILECVLPLPSRCYAPTGKKQT